MPLRLRVVLPRRVRAVLPFRARGAVLCPLRVALRHLWRTVAPRRVRVALPRRAQAVISFRAQGHPFNKNTVGSSSPCSSSRGATLFRAAVQPADRYPRELSSGCAPTGVDMALGHFCWNYCCVSNARRRFY